MTQSLLALHHHYAICDGVVDLRIDSKVAMFCINCLSSRSPALNAALRRLYALCPTLGLTLRASWLASLANLWADKLSRDHDRTNWRLSTSAFSRLSARYGTHEVDLFATCLNAHCAHFFSFPASPGCDGIEAFRQDWSSGNLYANPPFAKIPMVLSKVAAERATVTFILPVWQDQDWWPVALAHANEVVLLPRSAGIFRARSVAARHGPSALAGCRLPLPVRWQADADAWRSDQRAVLADAAGQGGLAAATLADLRNLSLRDQPPTGTAPVGSASARSAPAAATVPFLRRP